MRVDLSHYLVHWTKGETDEAAYQTLLKICTDELIKGTIGPGVYGCDRVICFTETPAKLFHSDKNGKLKQFGVSISKHEIFNLGGLPVIYQPSEQRSFLDKNTLWRHVDFNLNSFNYSDYTWQREWRLKMDSLRLNGMNIYLLVPDNYWATRLNADIHNENCNREYFQSCMLGGNYEFPLVLSGKVVIKCLK